MKDKNILESGSISARFSCCPPKQSATLTHAMTKSGLISSLDDCGAAIRCSPYPLSLSQRSLHWSAHHAETSNIGCRIFFFICTRAVYVCRNSFTSSAWTLSPAAPVDSSDCKLVRIIGNAVFRMHWLHFGSFLPTWSVCPLSVLAPGDETSSTLAGAKASSVRKQYSTNHRNASSEPPTFHL